MHIKFLGTGGAFDFDKGTAAAIVNVAGKNILIDCGFSTILTLAEKDLAKDIDYILITHLHGDHIGGLPTLLQYICNKLDRETPPILVPTLSFQADLEVLFTSTFVLKHAQFVPAEHIDGVGYIDTSDQHGEGIASFAYYFTEKNHLKYYSGDIGNADVAAAFLSQRNEPHIQVFHETTPRLDTPAHASYKEIEEKLGTYDTYVYHIAKENMPTDCTLKYVEDFPEFLA